MTLEEAKRIRKEHQDIYREDVLDAESKQVGHVPSLCVLDAGQWRQLRNGTGGTVTGCRYYVQ